MPKMDKRVKKLWLKALRSKEYEQGRNHLYQYGKWCCLGVLCDLYRKEKGLDVTIHGLSGGEGKMPGEEVIKWAKLQGRDGIDYTDMAGFNDNGYSFRKIANIIEKSL